MQEVYSMERQFTATVYIIAENKVLLLMHPKVQKWLPPGGHLEANEIPSECAKREALEETGLTVELIKEEHVWVDRWNATSFERPWLCLLENMPAYGSQPAVRFQKKSLPNTLSAGFRLRKFWHLNLIRRSSLKPSKAFKNFYIASYLIHTSYNILILSKLGLPNA
jgi:8-oxo-dGTP pyrophosphatase MutT (NUDIX family)